VARAPKNISNRQNILEGQTDNRIKRLIIPAISHQPWISTPMDKGKTPPFKIRVP
jgi:hypothetical protein